MIIKSPLVSVLIPVYNAQATLIEAIESILTQTLQDIELILVNDGSTDNSSKIINDLKKRDNRIKHIQVQHAGIVNALNTGLEHCNADYILRMDADDISLPDRIEKQLNYLIKNNLDLCSTQVQFFSESTIKDGLKNYQDWLNLNQPINQKIFIENPLPHPSWLVKKSTYIYLNSYQNNSWPEDYDFILRAYLSGMKLGMVDEELTRLRQHENRLTWTDKTNSLNSFMRCRAHYLNKWLLINNKTNKNLLFWGGRTALKLAETMNVKPRYFIDVDKKKKTRKGIKVIHYENLIKQENVFIIISIGKWNVREKCTRFLTERGFIYEKDYIFAG